MGAIILIFFTIISNKTFFTFRDFSYAITESTFQHDFRIFRIRLFFHLIVVVHCENKQF